MKGRKQDGCINAFPNFPLPPQQVEIPWRVPGGITPEFLMKSPFTPRPQHTQTAPSR